MIIDFDKLRHLSQFSVPLLLAALLVIFFHNGKSTLNLQLNSDERLQHQQETLQEFQSIFLDYLVDLQLPQEDESGVVPLSIFPEFAPLPEQDHSGPDSSSSFFNRSNSSDTRTRLLDRLRNRDRRH